MTNNLIVTLRCKDQRGIVKAVADTVFEVSGNIVDSAQFWDQPSNSFSLRMEVQVPVTAERALEDALHAKLAHFDPVVTVRAVDVKRRALVMVTTADHCLRELLYQWEAGELGAVLRDEAPDRGVDVGRAPHEERPPLGADHMIGGERAALRHSGEIDAVEVSNDITELGDFNPNVRAEVAVNAVNVPAAEPLNVVVFVPKLKPRGSAVNNCPSVTRVRSRSDWHSCAAANGPPAAAV